MRRLILVGLVLASVLALTAGTTNAQMPIKFGIKGGINSASVTGDDAGGYEKRSTLVGGVMAELSLFGRLTLQSELLYTQKGAKGSINRGGETTPTNLKMTYIEIPVLLKYHFQVGGPFSPFLFAGPAFSINKSSKTELEGTLAGFPVSAELDNFNERSNDVGLVLGGGAGFSAGPAKLIVDLRFTVGLEAMWEDVEISQLPQDQLSYVDETTGTAQDMKNSVFSATIGFMF